MKHIKALFEFLFLLKCLDIEGMIPYTDFFYSLRAAWDSIYWFGKPLHNFRRAGLGGDKKAVGILL